MGGRGNKMCEAMKECDLKININKIEMYITQENKDISIFIEGNRCKMLNLAFD